MKVVKYFIFLSLITISWFCYSEDFFKSCDSYYTAQQYTTIDNSDPSIPKNLGLLDEVTSEGAHIKFTPKQFASITPLRGHNIANYFGSNMEMELLEYCNQADFAKLYYFKGAANSQFAYIPLMDPASLAEHYPEFKNRAVEPHDKGKASSPIGTVEYNRFSASGGLGCFNFDYVYWYENLNRPIAVGGYYCHKGGKELTHEDIKLLLASLRVDF